MYYTGFADEAGGPLDVQIKATKELGWNCIETRKLEDGNLASIDDATFEKVCQKLDETGIKFNCYGSAVGNWATSITKSPESSYEEMRKAGPRMKKLGIDIIRIMSFPVPAEDFGRNEIYQDEAIKRIKTICEIAADYDVTCLHENCSGWAGLSYEHTLTMLEKVNMPNLKLVFDTGNPTFDPDVRGEAPYKMQDAWEFYENVKDHIVYVHIKDGIYDAENKKQNFTFPGEGNGYVRKIVKDLLKNGYDGGFSMEPHLAVVAHDSSIKSDDDIRYNNYVEYGRRFMKIIDETKAELGM